MDRYDKGHPMIDLQNIMDGSWMPPWIKIHDYPSWDEMHFFQDSRKILGRTCKIMHYSYIILQDLTKNYQFWEILADEAFLARFTEGSCKKYVICRILPRFTSSARILHKIKYHARIFEDSYFLNDLQKYCKICISAHLRYVSSTIRPWFPRLHLLYSQQIHIHNHRWFSMSNYSWPICQLTPVKHACKFYMLHAI